MRSHVATALNLCLPSRLLLLALGLSLFPRLLLFLSESSATGEARGILTPLESFLALHFGIWLTAIAATLILNVRFFRLLPHFAI